MLWFYVELLIIYELFKILCEVGNVLDHNDEYILSFFI